MYQSGHFPLFTVHATSHSHTSPQNTGPKECGPARHEQDAAPELPHWIQSHLHQGRARLSAGVKRLSLGQGQEPTVAWIPWTNAAAVSAKMHKTSL